MRKRPNVGKTGNYAYYSLWLWCFWAYAASKSGYVFEEEARKGFCSFHIFWNDVTWGLNPLRNTYYAVPFIWFPWTIRMMRIRYNSMNIMRKCSSLLFLKKKIQLVIEITVKSSATHWMFFLYVFILLYFTWLYEFYMWFRSGAKFFCF